ncbi:hypothetical protein [Roseibium aggregatum]|uniref:Uncharacterized protein n=1 Tax=Roseibium aggregatum TaxID=187304 RepID=A0A926S874_9HYPH|nr:hypothetical protein [Roseibium aggregatum]MBD1549531.1 hypothetical protein [Roseibium aggregatum]
MGNFHKGTVFPVRELSEKERADTRAELEWLERDLIRRRKRLDYWTRRKHDAETLPNIPDDLRSETLYFFHAATRLVETGERLRAFLLVELASQPDHAPAYHQEH